MPLNDQDPSDEELMEGYLAGDASAFRQLLDRYGDKLFNFILRSVGSREVAEELLQEVFLRVVRRAETFRRQSKFSTWLYTIARNLCIDTARKARHRRTLSLDRPVGRHEREGATLLDQVSDGGPGPDRRTRDERFRRALEQALAALPDEQREVFVMREFQGLKFREIATIVGIPENTIKSRMRYALQGLRSALAQFQETL